MSKLSFVVIAVLLALAIAVTATPSLMPAQTSQPTGGRIADVQPTPTPPPGGQNGCLAGGC